jgi:hypothetical protein
MAQKTAPHATNPKAANKGEILAALTEKTGLGKKQIDSVFAALNELIARELGKKGPGQFVIPGLLKLKVVRKPATRAKAGLQAPSHTHTEVSLIAFSGRQRQSILEQ